MNKLLLAAAVALTTGCASFPTPWESPREAPASRAAPTARDAAGHPAATVPDVRDAATLKPGEFTWHPECAPSGPVVIIVSIPEPNDLPPGIHLPK